MVSIWAVSVRAVSVRVVGGGLEGQCVVSVRVRVRVKAVISG